VATLTSAQQLSDRCAQIGCHLVEGLVALIGVDAACRDDDRLGGGAHLSGIQAQRERDIAQHALVIVGGLDHEIVHARQFGIDLRLPALSISH
jgi:hypothetical protein